MAFKKNWTVGDMDQELKEVVDSWRSKVPGLSNNKETQQAKEMHQTFGGLMEVVGKDATAEALVKLKKVDKLRAAVAGKTTVEAVNAVIQQFEIMALMHRVVRSRKLSGKPIPQSIQAMQAVMQAEGPNFLSKEQRLRMMKQQKKEMMRNAAKRQSR